QNESNGDFLQVPVQRVFISEAGRIGVGTYAPHDPSTADIADLVGSVDLSQVSPYRGEGDAIGRGAYPPHAPSTADIADLVGSVDLSKVSQYGDEGDPRAWSWSGAVYAASRGVLEMIDIMRHKRQL